MKVKTIRTVLLIALILTSCAPAGTVVPPTGTAAPPPTFTPILPTVTLTPTSVPNTGIPTSEPIAPLSSQGPWLVYRHNNLQMGYADVAGKPEEFVILNQDGSGRTLITLPKCDVDTFFMGGDNSVNTMVNIGRDIYIFRPSQATGLLVYRQLWFSYCGSYFNGDEKGGLLTSFYQASKDVSPELLLYELPSGKVRERFPLVRCSKETTVCDKYRSNWPEMMLQQPQWSPNGRYLAFVTILDATSSDLFVYDAETRKLRRLTNGPDWVGPIEWSPDGTQIIMQEILNDTDEEFLFDPHSKPPSSVWSVSVSTSEIKMLYFIEDASTIQNILYWLDDRRFIAYEGFLVDADQAHDLRLVDMETGANRILFNGVFGMIDFDPIHEVFAVYEINTEYCLPTSICLVSMNDGAVHALESLPNYLSFPHWDKNTGLFVSSTDCESDPQSLQAVDYQGAFQCVPKPMPPSESLQTASYVAPNKKWSILVNNAIWLETDGSPAIQVSQEPATDVIWCPDSNCFFFSVLQQDRRWDLYRVSLPDLLVTLVDEGIESRGTYRWLEIEQ